MTPGNEHSSSIQRPDLAVYCPIWGAGPGNDLYSHSRGTMRERLHRTLTTNYGDGKQKFPLLKPPNL